ncbi:MAG: hypothetical protein WBH47_19220, partial [Streptosporangiaceae bacterium]
LAVPAASPEPEHFAQPSGQPLGVARCGRAPARCETEHEVDEPYTEADPVPVVSAAVVSAAVVSAAVSAAVDCAAKLARMALRAPS